MVIVMMPRDPEIASARATAGVGGPITEQIGEVALSSPKALIGMSVWSLPKLRQYLIDQNIVPGISMEHLRQILRSRNLAWRVLWLTMTNRTSPELPATLVFTGTEIKLLERLVPAKDGSPRKTVGAFLIRLAVRRCGLGPYR